MPASEVVHDIAIRGRPEGLRELAQQANAVAAAQDNIVASTERLEKRTLSTQTALNRVQREYDAAFRAQEKIARVNRTLDRSLEQRLINETRHAQLLSLATDRINKQVGANDNLRRSSEQATHQMGQLSFQVQDVVASLGSGASPLTVFFQQSGQIYSALDGPSGVSGGLRNVAARVKELVTPARVLGVTFAAAGALAYSSWSRFDDLQRQVLGTLQGVGRQLGLNADQFLALGGRAAQSGDLSVARATDIANTLARTGQLSAQNIERITSLTKSFAATFTGGDLAQAQQMMADLFKAPEDGIQRLLRLLPGVTAEERKRVTLLIEQGDRQKAVAVGIEAASRNMASFNETVSRSTGLWERIKNYASDIDMSIGRMLSKIPSLPSAPEAAVSRARERMRSIPMPAGGETARAIAQRDALPDVAPLPPPRPMTDADQLARGLGNRAADMVSDDLQADMQSLVDQAKKYGNALDATIETRNKYLAQSALFERVLKSGNQALMEQARSEGVTEEGLEKLREGLRTLIPEEERRAQSRKLDVEGARAQGAAAEGRVAAQRKELELAGQTISKEERLASVAHERTMAMIRQQNVLRDLNQGTKLQAEMLDLEARSIGMTESERAVAIAQLQAVQQLQRQNIPLTEEAARKNIAAAKANAEQAEAIKKLKESMDFASGTATEFVKGFASDLRRGTDAVEALTNAFGRLADRLSDRAIDLAMSTLTRAVTPSLMPSATAHTGGVLGHSSLAQRYVHPAYFDDAQRFRRGGIMGLGPDEIPIIGHRGEEVLRRDDPRHRWNSGGQGMNVTINNAPPGTTATQAPDGSLMVNVASAVVAANNQSRDYRGRKARPL